MSNQSFKNAGEVDIGTSFVTVYTAPVGEAAMALQVDVSNITGSGVLCEIAVNDVSEAVEVSWVKNTLISAGSTLSVISGQKLILEPGDELKIKSNTIDSLDALVSLMEDINDSPGTLFRSKCVSGLGWAYDVPSMRYYKTIYTAPVGQHSQLLQLDLCNLLNSGVLCDIELVDVSASKTIRLARDIPVPVGSPLQYIESQKVVLDPEDYIVVKSPSADALDVIVSLMEDLNV